MTQRSCVVTGGSRGIGAAIVLKLASMGYFVVSLDLGEPSQSRPNVGSIAGDVVSRESHARAAQLASQMAPLQAWVNCAGVSIPGSVDGIDDRTLTDGLAVNLLGTFYGCAAACGQHLSRSGETDLSIVNVSSIHATVGFPGNAAYAMSKGGVEALTRQIAAEYVREGVRCNAVAPGFIDTPMNADLLERSSDPDGLMESWKALTPMTPAGEPADVAEAVAYFVDSQRSRYVTGQVLRIDGGATTVARGC